MIHITRRQKLPSDLKLILEFDELLRIDKKSYHQVHQESETNIKLSCIDKPRTLTANVMYKPTSLPLQVEWYKVVGEDSLFLYKQNEIVSPNENGVCKIQYNDFRPDAEGEQKISAKVYVCAPDPETRWTDAYTEVEPVTITVYPKPENAVTQEALRNSISYNYKDEPEKLIGYAGQPNQQFKYSVSDLDSRYHWTYNWYLCWCY